ncbi:hypothetical protein sos41_07100 [Alphaproteobacteria bacterium SO-S41]|nr:hypothetical protein sos41_07100 [Alphaproteobacteria bacterium SO-S41]
MIDFAGMLNAACRRAAAAIVTLIMLSASAWAGVNFTSVSPTTYNGPGQVLTFHFTVSGENIGVTGVSFPAPNIAYPMSSISCSPAFPIGVNGSTNCTATYTTTSANFANITQTGGYELTTTNANRGGNITGLVTATYVLPPAPTVTSISPSSGPLAGGTAVTIRGTNFTPANGATIDIDSLADFTVVNSTTITGTTPAGFAPGAVDVGVSSPGGSGTLTGGFTYSNAAAPPTVTGVSPSSGPAAGGTLITITGTNFTGATAVTVGGASATGITVVNATTITATTPAGTAGARNVVVSTPGGNGTGTNLFTYIAAPTVTGVSPSSGPAAGGTAITITGTNFTGATAVTVGGTSATGITVINATTITATTPAGTAGARNVVVTTPGGNGTGTNLFTYIAAPTVTGVSPSSGPASGGTAITITGTNFTGATAVTVGGTSATGITVVNATTITATTPAGTAGARNVVVTTPGGTGTGTNFFTYIAVPTVTSLSPTSGPAAGGTVVTLTGTNFTGLTAVSFGGTAAASFTFNSSTSITATSPAGTGTVNVRVTTPGGTSATGGGNQFTYTPAPTVTGVSPLSGPLAGGTSVTITGTNFTGATIVTIGGTSATGITVVNATTITATTPAGTAGARNVAVTTPGGTGTGVGLFTYAAAPTVTAISPNSGPAAGGTGVTITGTNFTGATAVTIGGAPATGITVVNATTITATAPAGTAGARNVVVTTPGGTGTGTGLFTYIAAPTVASVSPNSGPLAGGNTITITGANFTGATAVSIGQTPASNINVINATTITVTVPASVSAGARDVSVTTPGGSGTGVGLYTYVSAPVVTSVSPASGPAAGGTAITITGTDFTGATMVTIDGVSAMNVVVVNATTITAQTPAGTPGARGVSVMAPGGTSGSSTLFTYIAAPTVTAVNVDKGPLAGGTAITITGTNFTGATAVTVGGAAATGITVVNATTITATTPAGTAGARDIVVTTPGGTGTGAGLFTYFAVPTIGSVSPNAGPVAGGTAITITGTNLSGATTVSVGGAAATNIVIVNASTITATTPAGTAGARDVVVATPGGTGTGVGFFTYFAVPAVASVNPNGGPLAGGTSITITGTNFTGATAVTIGGAAATGIVVVNASTITATTPAGTAGARDVAVTTPGGTGTGAGLFTYFAQPAVTGIAPPSGSPDGGTVVTITGTGFTGATGVMFGDLPAAGFTVIDDHTIIATTPPGVPGGAVVSVTTPGGSGAGAGAGGSFTFDDTAPVLAGVPANIAVNTDAGLPTGVVSWTPPTATDDVPGVTVAQTAGHAPGAAFPVGVTTITYVATDGAGNTASASFTVTVSDAEAPLLAGVPANITKATDAGLATAVVTWTAPTATDNVPGVTVAQTAGLAPGAAFPIGVTTITYVATDVAGNTASASFTVTVGDNQPPVLAGVPANIAVVTDTGLPTAVVTWTPPTATDNAPGATVAQTAGFAPGAAFPLGVTTITYVATDAAGNTANASFTVTVTDGEAPVLVAVPANIARATDPGLSTAVVTWTPPIATDNAPGVTVARTAGPAPGSAFPLGVTTITYVATDAAGRTASASFTVTVGDTELPVLANMPANIARNTDAGLNTAVVTWAAPTASDNVPGVVLAQIAGPASGSAFPLGVTTITYRATDTAGNTASASFTVTVGDGEAPKLASTPGNIVRATDAGQPTAVVTYALPTFTDNVGITGVTQIAGRASGAAFPIGATTNTFRAVDAVGNSVEHSFTVTVNDGQPPQIDNLPANQSYQIDFPQIGRVVTWTAPTASDNAPGVTLAQVAGPTSGSTFPVGVTTITYRATDVAGNITNASFTVAVAAVPPGTVTFIVVSPEDGSFGFTAAEPVLNVAVAASAGGGRSAAIPLRPGTYPFAFSVPDGFGVSSASCSAGGTISATGKTGQIVLTSGQSVTCTVSALPSRMEAENAIGDFLDVRANLIVANGPNSDRRIDRLNGNTGGGGGTVSAFGIQLASSMPFSLQVSADKASFSYSLRRARAMEQTARASLLGASEMRTIGAGSGLVLAANDPGTTVEALQAPAGGERFDFWVEGTLAGFDAGGGDGSFAIFHAGADYLVTPDLLVGVGLQIDWTDMDTANNGNVSGKGFLAGPYLTARLSENLYLDARVAWGSSDNDVSPFGTYQDTFSADRTLVTGALIGEFQTGKMMIRPEARLTWFEEETDAYRDGLGVDVPAITVSTGQLQLGPEFSWQIVRDSGAIIAPRVKLDAIWTFEQENTGRAATGTPGLFDTGVRGRIDAGLNYANESGVALSFGLFYDGIGDSDFQAWGGTAQVKLPF